MRLHIVEQELSGTLHHRQHLAQKSLVTRIEIMLPNMGGQPGTTRGEHAPGSTVYRTGNAPEVGIVMGHPTTAAIHLTGRLSARHTQVLNHREQGLLGFSQITYQGRPVVHLGIDVDGVFGIPGGIALVVPYALQVGWLSARLRRADEQVAAILEHEGHKGHILAILECSQSTVGRQS